MLKARATLRLAALMAVSVAVLSLGAMALQYRLVATRLTLAQKELLSADLRGLGALYEQRRIIALRQAIDYRAASGGEELLLLTDREGRILAGTESSWPAEVAPEGAGFDLSTPQEITRDTERWLVVARELPGGFGLLAGRPLAPVDATLAALRRGMIGLALALLAAAALVGWVAARQVMGRIGRLNRLADQVAAGDLEARLPGPRRADEFGLLETHMHHMLDRIASLNRATHRLSDTIAHEMRTPLNRLATRLSEIEGQEEKVSQLREEMRGAIRIFDSLLDISRAEADQGSGGGLLPVDLSALAEGVWELYEALAEDKGLIPAATIAPDLMVLGDRTLISQMLANVMDNAIKYCAPGDRLTLTLTAGPLHILEIADSGPGLPEGMGEDVFERFTRAGRDRARGIRGHGLGLALVRAIAMRHGAKLSLPGVEKGLTIRLEWQPLASG
ncbi:sensor histidine kinase [Pseudogemmobacter bohemicus]|uniref:sensor histidine kinase n=1 Tax=Pseudogemmobacter bohemicus TaxID=2250708 RepID=UPI000DD34BFC|nr:HAMP domain-containing sensor histidine kinase [Pseudogemmobacter bohemicus]